MKRESFLAEVRSTDTWDIIVIGGGATGLGVAVDAASRGYRTLLLEQSDFSRARRAGAPNWCMAACATSSRVTWSW